MQKSIVENFGWSLRDNYFPSLKERIKDWCIPKGRVRRRDLIIFTVFYALLSVSPKGMVMATEMIIKGHSILLGLLILVWGIFWLYASICMSIKRFHDTNHSGWYNLFVFIPLVNLYFFVYVLYFERGELGPNEYGSDPRKPFDEQYE